MKTAQHKAIAETVESHAANWFVRLLDDDVTGDEILAWETWLRSSPRHGAAFDQLADLWCAAGAVQLPPPATPAQIRADKYDGSIPLRQWLRRPHRLKLIWAASSAAVAAAAALLWVVAFPGGPMDSRHIVTARAEVQQAKLADGSTVTVGGRSRVDVAFSRTQRRLALTSGEALFQVAHEPQRPFVVRTPLGDVTAVGTAFDVNVQSRTVSLVVSQGVVSVAPRDLPTGTSGPGGLPLRVAAGEKLLLDQDGVRLVRIRQGEALAPTWTAGFVEYRDTPLRTVLEDVNRYAERPIVLTDAKLGDLTYTGAVKLSNTLAWAQGLGGAFPIVADMSDEKRITLRRKVPALPVR